MKLSPRSYARAYLALTNGLRGVELEEATATFWQLVWRKRHFTWRQRIVAEVAALWNQAHGVVSADVQAPRPLTKALEGSLEKSLGAKAEITLRLKPHLLAGVVVTVGDKRYDASLKGRLDALESALAGNS